MQKTKVDPIINIMGLSKTYHGMPSPALNNLNIQVYPGEVYGFLGPNGAGKSTTIRLLANFIQPTSGTALLNKNDIVKDSLLVRSSIGYLSGDLSMYPKMNGQQFLTYLAELQGINLNTKIESLAKLLNADLTKRLGELSRGNRQKIGIIQAFMHDPKILILDEPTSGLDPLVQETFYDLVRDSTSRGSAVFMSSHVLSEVQKICGRVGIIKDGILVTEKVIADMVTEAAHSFEITFKSKTPLAELMAVKGIRIDSHSTNNATVSMFGDLSDLFAVLARHNVVKIEAHNLDLEDTFMQYYTQDSETKS